MRFWVGVKVGGSALPLIETTELLLLEDSWVTELKVDIAEPISTVSFVVKGVARNDSSDDDEKRKS